MMTYRGFGARTRMPSGLRLVDDALPSGDRSFALTALADRWSEGAIAAALTYPEDYLSSVDEWVEFLDTLERCIHHAERDSATRLRVRT